MKRTFRYLATAAITAAAIAFTACNADDDFYMEPLDSASPETRADVGTDWVTVTFDDVPEDQLAGPSRTVQTCTTDIPGRLRHVSGLIPIRPHDFSTSNTV